jgi:hypothetical protein
MPKRNSKSRSKRPTDINQLAHQLVKESTQEPNEQPSKLSQADISRIMAEMGRRGGKIGGKRRLKTMTPQERKRIAIKAAKARWSKS